jgi:hypothetical protein
MSTRAPDDLPWRDDLAALRDATRKRLPLLQETRQLALANETNKENTVMTLFRKRPLVATAVVVAAMLVLVPVSYAVVTKILITFDHEASPEEIESDVREQLEGAGIDDAVVNVDKDDDSTSVMVAIGDPTCPDLEISTTDGRSGETEQRRLEIAMAPEQQPQLQALTLTDEFQTLMADPPADDEAHAAALRRLFEDHGFTDVRVEVTGDRIAVSLDGADHTH